MTSRRHLRRVALALLLGSSVGCRAAQPGGSEALTLETENQMASYAIGLDIGGSLSVAARRIDMTALEAGIADGLAEATPMLTDEQMGQAMMAFNQAVQVEMQAQAAADAAANAQAGEAYRTQNATKPGVTTTPTGLQYEVLRAGNGPRPGPTDRVVVHYRGTLVNGSEFDTSYGREPVAFGLDGVIPGFAEGLSLMPVGSQYRFVMPPSLAYGPVGSPPVIGPDETLIFEVELIRIE